MNLRHLLLVLGLAAAGSVHGQIFNSSSSTTHGLFSTFDGPIDVNASPNYFGGFFDTGLLSASFNGSGEVVLEGVGSDYTGATFYAPLTLNLSGSVSFTLDDVLGGHNEFVPGSLKILLGDFDVLPGLVITGFTIDSQNEHNIPEEGSPFDVTVTYLGATYDSETGFLTIAADEAFVLDDAHHLVFQGHFTTAAIPEPATVALGFGLAAIFAAAGRRRMRAA